MGMGAFMHIVETELTRLVLAHYGLAGGVIVKGTALRAAFVEAAAALGCNLAPVSLVSEPARGAVTLALGQIGDSL